MCLVICNARGNLLSNLYNLYSNLQRCQWHPVWQLPSRQWRPARQQYSEQEMVLDSPQVGIPPFSSCCTGWYMHTPQFYSPTLQKSLEVIRWESLPFCCCTGMHIPLSTLLSSFTNVFSSQTVETPSLCHTHIPLWSLERYSTGQQTFGDNRVHAFVIVVVHISLNFTLLRDQSCGVFRWELHPFHCCTGTHTSLSSYSPTWQIEFWTVVRWELTPFVLTLVHTYTPLNLRDRRVLDSQQVGTPPVSSHTGTHIYPSQFTWQKSFWQSTGGNSTC